jgi:hypothetical protein
MKSMKRLMTPNVKLTGWTAVAALALLSLSPTLRADGTETLGEPAGISLASGSGYAVGGLGLAETNAGTLQLVVPTNASVQQVLLYWEGASETPAGDDSVKIGTNPVTGALIGGPTQIFPGVFESAYRADITALGLVQAGTNDLALSGVDFSQYNNGAGAIVIYSNAAPVLFALVDGDDFALEEYLPPLDTTEPQTFHFTASASPRLATLGLLVGGGEGLNTLHLALGCRRFALTNVLNSKNGPVWDSVQIPVRIPAGVTDLSVQVASGDGSRTPGQSALISWVAAALSLPAPEVTNYPPRVALCPVPRAVGTTNRTQRVTVRGWVADPDTDTLTVTWFVNGAALTTNSVDLSGTDRAPIALTYQFPVGTNVVRVTVSDGTNAPVSVRTAVRVIRDTQPPVVICPPPKYRQANPHGIAHVPGFGVIAWDNCTPCDQLIKTQTPKPGTPVGPGIHVITIQVTDASGNTSTCRTRLIVTPHKQVGKPAKPEKPGKDGKHDKHGRDDGDH